jgi:hypothetical protein
VQYLWYGNNWLSISGIALILLTDCVTSDLVISEEIFTPSINRSVPSVPPNLNSVWLKIRSNSNVCIGFTFPFIHLRAIPLYIAPVLIWINPSFSAAIFAVVLLPEPDGPSIAIIGLIRVNYDDYCN